MAPAFMPIYTFSPADRTRLCFSTNYPQFLPHTVANARGLAITFKQWRGLASRYDKLAVNYRGGAILRAILIWTNDLCVTP
jgi:hypothetical protein